MSQTPADPAQHQPSPPPRQLTAEVVSIGDEMTSGARLDTNAQWLSRRLGEIGVHVAFHSTVGDTLQHNVDVFRIACERADVVVATGGLGPTRDDLTREALAAVVDRPLVMRDSAMQHIEALFARRRRPMPERNQVQAMFPEGSDEIFNPQGTAPGIDLAVPRPGRPDCRIFALPGVPAEMKTMFDETVATRILTQAGSAKRIRQLVMKFFGAGESDMEHRLGEMIARDRQPRVGITASNATISLRITATGDSDEVCDEMIAETRDEVLRLLPQFYFGEGESFEQYHAIDELLRQRDQSLMVIELGRAAPLGDWFASLGETPAYRGGLSLATVEDLQRLVDAKSEDEAMERVRQACGVNWLLVVDQYPLIDRSGSMPKATPIRFVVIAPDGESRSITRPLGGHPEIVQAIIAKNAMRYFREQLAEES